MIRRYLCVTHVSVEMPICSTTSFRPCPQISLLQDCGAGYLAWLSRLQCEISDRICDWQRRRWQLPWRTKANAALAGLGAELRKLASLGDHWFVDFDAIRNSGWCRYMAELFVYRQSFARTSLSPRRLNKLIFFSRNVTRNVAAVEAKKSII